MFVYYLVLQELGKGSSGSYSCTATNTEGTGESIPQKLDVKCKFFIKEIL